MDKIEKSSCTLKPVTLNFEKKVELISKILPGGDCKGHGGCKQDSCLQCAQEIAGGSSVDLCPACSQEKVNEIAYIVGKKPIEVYEKVAFIKCIGQAAGKKRLSKCKSCEEAKQLGFLEKECQYGCIGIGSCIDRCNFNAMSIKDGNILIDKERCNGCGACTDICPQLIISIIPKEATNFIPCSSKNDEKTTREICRYGCIGCGECEDACPEGAIKIVGNCATIDYEKCVGCVACTVKCKKKIIIDSIHDITKVKNTVAFVRCKGGKKARAKFEALGMDNCKQASKVRSEAMGLCMFGCIGLGECTKACRFDAIHIVNGTAKIDPNKCVGCLDCTYACPNNLIVEIPYKGNKNVACASTASPEEKQRVCGEGCISCGDCASNCPNGAVTLTKGCAEVDANLCENCHICSYVCSRQVLIEQVVPEENYLQRKALDI